MNADKTNPEINNEQEEHDDIFSMRENMDHLEDSPNTDDSEKSGGIIKSLGKIFTKRLSETDLNQSQNQSEKIPEEKTASNTKILPELNEDNQEVKTADPSSQQPQQKTKSSSSLLDLLSDAPTEAETLEDGKIFKSSPTQPVKKKQNSADLNLNQDIWEQFSKTKPLPDLDHEDFVQKVSNSLQEDLEDYGEIPSILPEEPRQNNALNKDDQLVYDVEDEIDRASGVNNPFEEGDENSSDLDFISRLKEMFPDGEKEPNIQTQPGTAETISQTTEDDQSLSKENWERLFKATEEKKDNLPTVERPLLPESEPKKSSLLFEEPPFFPDSESLEQELIDTEKADDKSSQTEQMEEQTPSSKGEELDTLRQSFIEDFEQSPWTEDKEEKKQNWLLRTIQKFTTWLKTLTTAERILMFLSILISIAVLIAIFMVTFNWELHRGITSMPPESLEVMTDSGVYPTGLQLPGGWFFFLQQGTIDNSGTVGKWEPQGAEWLANTTIRKVVAIPWSKQAEAVVLSLEAGDEIKLFHNNNEVTNYYVDKIIQVEYDNVRDTMIDTEPSLAVILYRDDKTDRLVIIARP